MYVSFYYFQFVCTCNVLNKKLYYFFLVYMYVCTVDFLRPREYEYNEFMYLFLLPVDLSSQISIVAIWFTWAFHIYVKVKKQMGFSDAFNWHVVFVMVFVLFLYCSFVFFFYMFTVSLFCQCLSRCLHSWNLNAITEY